MTFRGKWCLDLNWELVTALNGGQSLRWIAVENSGPEDQGRLPFDDTRFEVLAGDPPTRPGKYQASYHHATALQKALPLVRSRYLLILDPDFFVVHPNWIGEVLSYMVERRLAFFGAPHDPGRPDKYRYFPSVVFMLIDLGQADKAHIDFMPRLDEVRVLRSLRTLPLLGWALLGRPPGSSAVPRVATRDLARHVLRSRLIERFFHWNQAWGTLGRSTDTGYMLYGRFAHDRRFRSACITRVWENPLYSTAGSGAALVKRRLHRLLIPDRFSLYPRRREYSSTHSFKAFGLADIAELGWEEYLWQGRPFAFHVRGMFHGLRQVEPGNLRAVVQSFMASDLSGS